MRASLTIAQIMSLHSGFAYCSGKEIGAAVKFMIGHDSTIAAFSFQPYMAETLEQQYPWLRDVPKLPEDWRSTLTDFEQRYGSELEVKK